MHEQRPLTMLCLASYEKGAEFLLLPPTAFWWLEHYQEFRQHLEDRYRALLPSSCETCKIFALAGSNAERVAI